jgi:hypothetical protein
MKADKNETGAVQNSAGVVNNNPPAQKGTSFDNIMKEITNMVVQHMGAFMHQTNIYANLTPKERARLTSAGIRNYGFIEKTLDLGKDNPDFLPPHFDMAAFAGTLHDFDIIRQLYVVVEKFETLIWDCMLLKSDFLYKDALRVYNGFKEQAKGNVPGASDLLKELEPYFKKGKLGGKKATLKEEMRKMKSIAEGKTEGEIIVRNIKPQTTGGVHEIIEVTGKEHIEGKETKKLEE